LFVNTYFEKHSKCGLNLRRLAVSIHYCYRNFFSIEDVEKCSIRGGFRQKIRAIEKKVVVSAPSKRAYLA
jgi:hypothetical protein